MESAEIVIRPFLKDKGWNGAKKIYELDCDNTRGQVKDITNLGCVGFFEKIIQEYINDFFNKQKWYPTLDTEFEKNKYLDEIMTKFRINPNDIDSDVRGQIDEILKTYIKTNFFGEDGKFAEMVESHRAAQAQSGGGYKKKRSRSKSSKKRKRSRNGRKRSRKGRPSKKGRKSRK